MARLGEQVVQLLDDGRLEVPEQVRQTYDRVKDVEARVKAEAGRTHDNAYGAPRGFEPEAGGYADDMSGEQELDEHAEVAREGKK